jgi:hypothetical protein
MREKHVMGHEFKAFILALRAYGYRPIWNRQDPDGHKYLDVVDINGGAKDNLDEVDDNEVLILNGSISSDHPFAYWTIQSAYTRWKKGNFKPKIPDVFSGKTINPIRKRALSACSEILTDMENGLINEDVITALENLLSKNRLKH